MNLASPTIIERKAMATIPATMTKINSCHGSQVWAECTNFCHPLFINSSKPSTQFSTGIPTASKFIGGPKYRDRTASASAATALHAPSPLDILRSFHGQRKQGWRVEGGEIKGEEVIKG